MSGFWSGIGEIVSAVGAVGGFIGGVAAVLAWAYAVRAGRRADAAGAKAVAAQEQAAEALRRQADAYERIVALEERRARPKPARFRIVGSGRTRFLELDGGEVATGVDVDVTSGPSTLVEVLSDIPTDMHPGERLELVTFRGGTPGAARMVVTWTNPDGTKGEQTIAVS